MRRKEASVPKKKAEKAAAAKAPELVKVRFIQREAPWNAGDTDDLPRGVAARFVKAGVARLVEDEDEEE